MPKWKKDLEKKLSRTAAKKGLTGDRKRAYVYGTADKVQLKKTGKITHGHGKGK